MIDVWPVAILDFEASSLGPLSYPIEVGFARWRGLEKPIESWGTLIRPDVDWVCDGCWSKDAEALHGITQGELWFGLSPDKVCAHLNTELAGCLVCCHGRASDQLWLSLLYDAGNMQPAFELESMTDLSHRAHPGMARWLAENEDFPHRAREDAVWQMRAFAYGLRRRPERIVLS